MFASEKTLIIDTPISVDAQNPTDHQSSTDNITNNHTTDTTDTHTAMPPHDSSPSGQRFQFISGTWKVGV